MPNISTGATVARYDYDPSGRRVVEDRPASGGAVVIAYDGVDRVADFRSGACVGQYVHGPMVDDPVEVAAAGRQHTYHLDLQGSVRALTNAAGTLVAQFRFDPFGVTRNAVGATIAPPGSGGVGATEATQPFGYAARPYDAAVAQYDYRARVYVPALGRFLQRDPAGPVDGHLYAYAGNAPLAFGDPSGLGRGERAAEEPSKSGYVPTVNPGSWILSLRDGRLRAVYSAVVKERSAQAVKAVTAAQAADDYLAAEAAAREASDFRNATRAATQQKLSPMGRALSQALEQAKSFDERVAYYAKENPFETMKAVAQGAGKTRASLQWLSRWSKRAGYVGIAVGVGLSVDRIRRTPTPCVVFEEVGGTAGGLGGAIGGGAGGAALGTALLGGPVGWGVVGFSLVGAGIGSYFGDRSARYAIKYVGDCNE